MRISVLVYMSLFVLAGAFALALVGCSCGPEPPPEPQKPLEDLIELDYGGLCKNCGDKPEGIPLPVEEVHWWHYDVTIKNTSKVGITIEKRHRVLQSEEFRDPRIDEYDIIPLFGTDYIPPGEEITSKKRAIWVGIITEVGKFSITETYYILADNGERLQKVLTFSLLSDTKQQKR
jgi:uncharacterized protein affecting Mg2+/Co2+ transport